MLRLLSRPAAARPPLWFLLIAVLAFANLLRSWQAPILDRHEFRQVQTALSAHWMREEGASLAYPLPLFGPPWSVPMEFPLYQGLVAGVSKLTGCGIEPAGRAVSIVAFFALLPALAGLLAAAGFAPATRWPVLAAVLLTPVYMFYTRAVLIETTALGLAAWFLLAYVRGLAGPPAIASGRLPAPAVATGIAMPNAPAGPRWGWVAAACLLGALAATVKVTTFAVFCAPAAGWALFALWRRCRRTCDTPAASTLIAAVLPAAVALGAALWWVHFGDAIKAANPLAGFLSSGKLWTWNFGTFAQRCDPALWLDLARELRNGQCDTLPALVALAALPVVARPYRRGALLCTAAFLVGPLLFFNLYVVHDYYFCANALFLSAAVGLLIAGLFAHPRLPRPIAVAAALVCVAGQWLAYERSLGSYHQREAGQPPALAVAIRAIVPEAAVVLVANGSWNPLLPYYAQRRAIMLPDGRANDVGALAEVAGRLPRGAIQAFVWHGAEPMPLELRELVFGDLGFEPTPVAHSSAASLFVVPSLLASATAKLATGPRLGLSVTPLGPASGPPASEFKSFESPLGAASALCSPAPISARSLYGVGEARNGNLPCIVAHAPSQLVLLPPAGARRIAIVFGLADECIEPGSRTDGIEVTIFTAVPGELRRVLFHRSLNPVANMADRGVQTAQVELPDTAGRPLVFEAGIGPAGNLAFDWFYWYHIAVH